MSEPPDKSPLNPYVGIALASGGASVLIAFLGVIFLSHLSLLSDGTVWAVAAMVGAPAMMGMGIAFFMSQQTRVEPPVNPVASLAR